jgi:sodium-coupled monocarboxylate transporter 8/12
MDPSPFARISFWSVLFGLTTVWVSHLGVNQSCVQRFLAVPDIKFARKSVLIFVVGVIFIKACSCITGLIMYARYETCDPISTRQIKKLDQMLPYFVMDVAEKVPGLPGIFVAGIFSAALSSMSSSLNTVAGTIYEDFIRPKYPENTEKTASNIMKLLVVILGILILGLVFVVERMGQIFQITIVLSGLTGGTLLGIFTMGMLSRSVNSKGVMTGAISSMIICGILMVGAQMRPKFSPLPLRTDGCDASMNSTNFINPSAPVDMDSFPWVFRISFMYLGFLGMILLCIVTYLVSYWTGGCAELDEKLLAPFCRQTAPKQPNDTFNNVKYSDIEHSKNDVKKNSTNE